MYTYLGSLGDYIFIKVEGFVEHNVFLEGGSSECNVNGKGRGKV